MNFLSMKYFVAVAESQSITQAAEQLHITQQTLSAHLANIENEIGSVLIIRSTPLKLTYAGEIFLKYALQFEMLYKSLEEEMADVRAETRGKLHIGIAPTRGHALMPDLIAQFQVLYPQIEIQVEEASNDILTQKLIDRKLDLILASFSDDISEINSQVFYEEEVVLLISHLLLDDIFKESNRSVIASLKEKQDISLLKDCPFLLSNADDIAGKIGNRVMNEANFTPKISTQSNNIDILLELCAKGSGACFTPEILAQKTLSHDTLSQMELFRFGNTAAYPIKFGWHSQTYCRKAIFNFIQTALNWQ